MTVMAPPVVSETTFSSLDPGSGRVLASYPRQGAADVQAAIARARESARP